MIPGSGFGVGPLKSVVEYDTISSPIMPGIYELGLLSVDFSGSGLPVGDLQAVSLAATNSVLGVENPGDPPTFRFIDTTFVPPPEIFPIDNIVANESDFLLTALAGGVAAVDVMGSPQNILGGERAVRISFAPGSNNGLLVSAKIDNADVLDFVSSADSVGILELAYGQNVELNADFLGSGSAP